MKRMTIEQLENIVYCSKILHASPNEIAHRVGLSDHCVRSVLRTYESIQTEDWETVVQVVRKRYFALSVLTEWFKSYKKEMPAEVLKAFEERKKQNVSDKAREQESPLFEAQPAEPAVEERAQEIVPSPSAFKYQETPLFEKTEPDLSFYLTELIKVERERNELLTQLMDTVMPHWIKQIEDTVTSCSDVLTQEVVRGNGYLDKVAYNTKKAYRG